MEDVQAYCVDDPQSDLHDACIRGSINQLVSSIVNGADVNANNQSSAVFAARQGHTHVIQYLESCGLNMNACAQRAFEEARRNNHRECASYLLKFGQHSWAVL